MFQVHPFGLASEPAEMVVREEFLELLRTDQTFREEVRRQILTGDLLALPGKFDHLTELVGQALSLLHETVGVVRDLAEIQRRTEERVGQLDGRMDRVEVALERLTEAQRRTEAGLLRQGEQIQALISAQQRTEERVGQLDGRMERVEAALEQLTEAQRRTEAGLLRQGEQIQALIQAQQQTEERVGQLDGRMDRVEVALERLTEAQRRTEEELRWLANWQRGEAGRRDGERYEREITRRAAALFNGGQGGAPDQPLVQQRLAEQLGPLLAQGLFEAGEDPFLSDLLWWKGEQIAVVEISIQVNGDDVVRAARRAGTLGRAGAQALAVVIGEHWATSDTREQALARQVDWKVGSDLSAGLLTFRRLSH